MVGGCWGAQLDRRPHLWEAAWIPGREGCKGARLKTPDQACVALGQAGLAAARVVQVCPVPRHHRLPHQEGEGGGQLHPWQGGDPGNGQGVTPGPLLYRSARDQGVDPGTLSRLEARGRGETPCPVASSRAMMPGSTPVPSQALPGCPCCFIATGTLLLDLELSRGQPPAPCLQPPVSSRGQLPAPCLQPPVISRGQLPAPCLQPAVLSRG